MRIPRFVKEQLESLRRDDEPLWRVVERLLDARCHQKPKKKKDDSNSHSASELWSAWLDAYRERYGVDYPRSAKVNSQLTQLKKLLGSDAEGVIRFYLKANDAWLLKTKHALGNLVKSAEAFHVRWRTGHQTVSDKTARMAEDSVTSYERAKAAYDLFDKLLSNTPKGEQK